MFALRKFETACDALSFQETRDLAWSLANPEICFNVSNCLLIDGTLDQAVLTEAIMETTVRHEALRTSFYAAGPNDFRRVVHQEASSSPDAFLEAVDMRHLPASHADVSQAIRTFTEKRFELDAYPLFHVLMIEVSDQKTFLVVSMAHVVSDAASTEVFMADLSKAYLAISEGQRNSLLPLDYTLSDFVQSHRAWMLSEDYVGQLETLRRKLVPGMEGLDADVMSCGVAQQRARKAAMIRNKTPADAYQKLADIARAQKVSPPAALLAVSALTLAMLMKKKRFFFSYMLSNRHYAGMPSIIGHIANAVPVFVDMQQGTVASFIATINKDFYLSACGVGIIPLGIVNQAVAGLDPVLSVKSPLNQLMINISAASAGPGSFAGMPLRMYVNPYAGFISNALQMNFSYAQGAIVQQCRCPEEQVDILGPRAMDALADGIRHASENPGYPLSDL